VTGARSVDPGIEYPKAGQVRQDQLIPEMLEHSFAVVTLPEFHGGELQHRAQMSTERLWRAVVQLVGDQGH
jgi:hypothetical protein